MNTQPDPGAAAQAAALIAAVEAAYQPPAAVPTSYRDDTPVPVVGSALPVPQPGRPPMSQRATDASALMLTASVASVPIGGTAAALLWVVGHIDPVAVAVVAAAPVPALLTLARVLSRTREVVEAAPDTHHHHYTAPVRQEHHHTTATARGVIARASTRT
ncbi:hypothetical protein [Streptomyces sp. NPDC023838]|uniref:hypothetical protein n=1 Tax=Streptomyces sp. NPDC023838 TaxID=3154325 RepID=UPI0033CC6D94